MSKSTTLVVRSNVPTLSEYTEYRPYLRRDFWHSCAYCTISEAEAQAIRFTIDHYEPKTVKPELEHAYSNLMYCCDECNKRKGDRSPPKSARESGVRFFRPDTDEHEKHFELSGRRLNALSEIGDFTIEAVDLNRLSLRRVREIRDRLLSSSEYISKGIQALRTLKIDQLPHSIRGRAHTFREKTEQMADVIESDIDALLQSYAKSDLIDIEADNAEQKRRTSRLRELKALYPGEWHGPRKKRT